MPDRLVIEGDLVRHERVQVISEAPVGSLREHLTERIATTYPILPANPVRILSVNPDQGRGLAVIETAPRLTAMTVQHTSGNYPEDEQRNEAGHRRGIFRVQVPWQYFVFPFRLTVRATTGQLIDFVIDANYLFWRKDQFHSLDDTFYAAPIPNVDPNGRICWGTTDATTNSLAERLDDLVNNFWTTIFNEHLGHRTPFGHSLTEWEANSPPHNPLAWRNWPWWNEQRATHYTGQQIIEHFGGPEVLTAPAAILDPSFVEIPPPPDNFSVARARDYLTNLTPAAQLRFAEALRELNPQATPTTETPQPEEATA